MIFFISGAQGIQTTVSGGDGSGRSDVYTTLTAAMKSAVNSHTTINGATVTPLMSISGPASTFEETHSVVDSTGKTAQVYVSVTNASSGGITYNSQIKPKEGNLGYASPWVSAEQWLTVTSADYLKCTATSSYRNIAANVSLEETKGPLSGDYVTLAGYYGKAYASVTLASASQIAASGSGNAVTISGRSKLGNNDYRASTSLKGAFRNMNEAASAGITNQMAQKEHITGTFTATARSGSKTKTRTSNYGTDYDLSLIADPKRPDLLSTVLGYYVVPGLSIQRAVNTAASGDTINVAAGTYKENVAIDRSLAVIGAGSTKTIVDGQKRGSVFTTGWRDHSANIALSGMKIQNGNAVMGGGINNSGKLSVTSSTISGNNATSFGGGIFSASGDSVSTRVTDCVISGNNATKEGGGIYIEFSPMIVVGGTISGNNAEYGGGIINYGDLTMTGSTISKNKAAWGGGIYNDYVHDFIYSSNGIARLQSCTISENNATKYGGGIFNYGDITVIGNTISRNNAAYDGGGITTFWGTAAVDSSLISGNKADYGGGIVNYGGTTTLTGNTISDNTALKQGGGIFSEYGLTTVTDTTISGNKADYGGGIINYGDMDVTGSTISGNKAIWGGGIYNYGDLMVTGSTVSRNNASYSGGIYSDGMATVVDSTISNNNATYNGGGIYNDNYGYFLVTGTSQITDNRAINGYGGGIYSYYRSSLNLDGTDVAVKFNKAHSPASESVWYKGWGIYQSSGIPTTTGGFDPATQVTGNARM